MDQFVQRTGLACTTVDLNRRYLWTDAFAVQTLFGLADALDEPGYHELALKLVDRVHETLGKYHPDDKRQGWINGLRETEAVNHPTIDGLRIGKALPERPEGEPPDEQLEWQRDGQYFHYHTRWFNALLEAAHATGEQKYARWAAELICSGRKFIYRHHGRLGMYWKMSTDLSRPLVTSMGAHDPLEGLICTVAALNAVPSMEQELRPLMQDFEKMCSGQDWTTTDALGIGGLLLASLRVGLMAAPGVTLPSPADPETLWADSLRSLQVYAQQHVAGGSPEGRLGFRECGLALGLRALHSAKSLREEGELNLEPLDHFISLATEIQDFWLAPQNQRASTWTGHLDINAVTLAASLVAAEAPLVFG